MPVPGQLLYTSEQAAVLLQMSPGWLRRQAAQGLASHVLIARKVRFTRPDLEEIIARHHRAAKRRA
ncbi:helix-turn-helix domain-containing protein [Streptacidiphilus rugosus]|uniref:helix-turn-helix domain-containing protein n=1 Tax=Streptacidiphilus rugosus TaxID=405783 RepID=UPI00056730BF|nr:helix-turn-helix domain-containing protein [Streptacidiphilus rugosus]